MNKETDMTMKLNPYFESTIETSNVVWSHDENSYQFNFDFTEYLCDKPFDLTDGKPRILLEFLNDKNAEVQIYPLIVDSEKLGVAHFIIPERVLGYVGDVKASLTIDFSNKSYDLGNFSFRMKKSPIDNKMPQLQFYVDEFEKAQDIFKNGLDEFNEDIKESNAKVDEIKDLIVQNDVLKKVEAGPFEDFRSWDDTLIAKMKNEFTERGINAKWFCVGDGKVDDTENFNKVITLAKNLKTSIYVPENFKIRVTSTIDLTGLAIKSLGTFIIDFNGIGIIVGNKSNVPLIKDVTIKNITHVNYSTNDISLRIQGAKRMDFTFGNMVTLELYADGDIAEINSTAYNVIKITGFITNVRIFSKKDSTKYGWINENTFIKGRITNVLIDGNYSHDMNVFIDTCVEQGTIEILKGTSNHFITMRNESIKSVFFAEGTYRNSIQFGYYGSNSILTYSSVTDLGTGNAVYSVNEFMPTVEVLDITKINIEKSTAVLKDGIDSIGNFVVLKAWERFVKFILPIDSFYEMECILNEETDQGMRYYITPLNESGNAVKEPGIVWIAGSSYDKETGVYTASIDSQKFTMLVHKPEKADKVMIEIGTSKKLQLNRLMMKAKTSVMKESYLESKKPIY